MSVTSVAYDLLSLSGFYCHCTHVDASKTHTWKIEKNLNKCQNMKDSKGAGWRYGSFHMVFAIQVWGHKFQSLEHTTGPKPGGLAYFCNSSVKWTKR